MPTLRPYVSASRARAVRSLALLPLLALAACDVKVGDHAKADGNDSVSIDMATSNTSGGQIALNMPGLQAKLDVPDISARIGRNLDIDGVKLAEGTKVGGINVTGNDEGSDKHDEGYVRLNFTNPQSATAVADHYRTALKDKGYTIGVDEPGKLVARLDEKTVMVTVTPDGPGSKGAIEVTGKSTD